MRLFDWLLRRRPTVTPPPPPQGDLLALHNAYRAASGLPPLVSNATLTAAAQRHAEWMANNKQLSHYEGIWPFYSRFTGYVYSNAGENIACGQASEAEAMQSWEQSPGHRANILGDFHDVGFGVAADATGVKYWCVDFGKPQ